MKRLLIVLIVLLLVGCSSAPAEPVPTATSTPTIEPTATEVPLTPTPQPTSTPRPPKISDFQLDFVITESQCFGSAGCLVTIRPDLSIIDRTPVGEWLLVYEIYGDEDGTLIANLDLDGTQYSFNPVHISTESADYNISVKITALLPN